MVQCPAITPLFFLFLMKDTHDSMLGSQKGPHPEPEVKLVLWSAYHSRSLAHFQSSVSTFRECDSPQLLFAHLKEAGISTSLSCHVELYLAMVRPIRRPMYFSSRVEEPLNFKILL